jgi:hypothetical protein
LELIIKIWRLVEFLFPKSGEFGLFSWKILPVSRNHIFQVGIWQKFANKRNPATGHEFTDNSINKPNFDSLPPSKTQKEFSQCLCQRQRQKNNDL